MWTALVFVPAALCEIGGCFAFWAWARLGRSVLWLLPGSAALVVFGWLLTLAPASSAGRAYAAYGGVYILTSLLWSVWVEGVRPDRSDLAGAGVALVGAAIILFGPHGPKPP
ncbi:small multidrug resistance family-3 protein [Endobacter medicaginis]|uniref:Small multidrug resistance family-3 protein n=1 Tax=Endobacter medicaginis TaxID=1181271 RepID=A0A850NQZ9_9PROT|nr:YnfA family protein [Endobacter medicaginis]MBB3173876.1 small multidrug resistance family-3 protein [Endobacter medicaginis]MCX5476158.1 YnfA family protein [Endobacter medicaginis]NVN30759.1 YnfA family protein [Endobacter medicaginis]